MRRIIGDGLAVAEGAQWQAQRALLQPVFAHRRIAGVADLANAMMERESSIWRELAQSGKFHDIGPVLARMTMRMTLRLVFGSGMSDQVIDRLGADLAYVMKYMLPAMLMSPLPSCVRRPGEGRYERALGQFDWVLEQVMDGPRAVGGRPDGLLPSLLDAADNGGTSLTATQARDEAMTMFLAGYETTATGLTWAAHYLSQHGDVADRMAREIESRVGTGELTVDDLRHLEVTGAAWKETLRMAPPIWWNPRRAVAEDVIDGYRIPAGTTVAPITYVVQRHPDFWEDADTFDPGRFLEPRQAARPAGAWFPFGHGQRYCVGQELANLEALTILASLVRNYRIAPDPRRPVRAMTAGTLRPRKGLWVRLEARA